MSGAAPDGPAKRPCQRVVELPDVSSLRERLECIDGGSTAADKLCEAQKACASEDWHAGARTAKRACDIAWQRLHTGHWAEVDAAWRSCYMVASLFAARAQWEEAGPVQRTGARAAQSLRVVDLGLMLGDTSYRALLLRAADYFEEQLAHDAPTPSRVVDAPSASPSLQQQPLKLRPLSGPLPPPPHLRLPSLAYFFNECMVPARPAVLTGVLDGWPAMTTRPWSDLSYLKERAGHRTVPVEMGRHYLDADFEETLLTLGEYIEKHIEGAPAGAPRAYLAQHQLFEQCPRLRADIVQPDYCLLSLDDDDDDEEEEDDEEESRRVKQRTSTGGRAASSSDGGGVVRVNAWLGPGGTLSPLHYDRYHNLLCQVVGSKYVRLYAPEQAPNLYPHTEGPHEVSSQIIDPDDVDASRFPNFAGAPYVDLVLRAGECLYIPPRMWHLIESRETSFSVSFWF